MKMALNIQPKVSLSDHAQKFKTRSLKPFLENFRYIIRKFSEYE